MMESKGNAATRAKNKYQAANYDRLNLQLPKGKRDEYRAAAERAGMNMNQFAIEAIEAKIRKEAEA